MKALPSLEALNLGHSANSRLQSLVIATVVASAMFSLFAGLRVITVKSFDIPVMLAVNSLAHRSRTLDYTLQALASFNLFQGVALVALAYGAFAASKCGRARVRLAIGIVGAGLASILSRLLQLVMPGLARPAFDPTLPFRRPYGASPEFFRDWSSFPSDHATLLWGMAIAVLMVNRRIGALSVAVAFLTSLARMYCGLHYPTDILAGVLLGAAVVCATLVGGASLEARLLAFARVRPALVATVGFLFGAQAATMFSDIRVIADATGLSVREAVSAARASLLF